MELDLSLLENRHAHDLIASSLIPRPIAWVSTVNTNGEINLAPFSFFTGMQWHPPVLAFSPVNRADGTKKDTVINIEQTGEFVINLVSVELLKPMEMSATAIPFGEDFKAIEGITFTQSKTIKPARVYEAKVSFECKLERIVRVDEGANAGNLILGRVQLMHIQDELLIDGREVDWRGLDALARLSGNRYGSITSVIESETN